MTSLTGSPRHGTPSVGRVAVPPRARPPVAPRPAYGRPAPVRRGTGPRHDPRRRPQSRSGGVSAQALLIGILVVATLGAGAWWAFLRGGSTPVGNFVGAEQQFAVAARAVPASADQVTDVKALRRWNAGVQIRLAEMDQAYARMTTIQSASTDEAARIVGTALATAAQVKDLINEYRDQVNNGALTTAASAAGAVETLLGKLDAQAKAWKKL